MKHARLSGTSKTLMLAGTLLLLMVLSVSSVAALGVAPSREIIDFASGKQTLEARIINNDRQDMRIAIYPQGELADYVTIPDDVIKITSEEGETTFRYELDLPEQLKPGTRSLGIVLVHLPETFARGEDNLLVTDETSILFENKDKESMISATTAVIHQLQVRVPYPNSFVEGKLHVSEGRVGDTLTFTVPVINRGSEPTEAYAEIIIKGPTNQEIDAFTTETRTLEPGKEAKLVADWKAEADQGVYLAEAIVHYGDEYFTLRKEFHVGNLFVAIDDLTVQGFKLGGIAKFDVMLKNRWNEHIKDVYGELKVLDEQGQGMANVKTLSTDLPAHGQGEISGYWDTTGVDVGRYDVNVVLHYAGKTTEKLFQTVVGIDKITVGQIGAGKVTGGEEGGGSTMSLLIILVAVLIVVNVGWFVFFRKRMKKPPERPPSQPGEVSLGNEK